ncbi:MAG: acyl-CoA thioesterase [Parachlamydiaceae bacterium]|nr:acyl-CoA thioesterase [Parachlamydiaceae bacterium]
MHDTDMAGILYFARQFRFAHDALEDMFEAEGYTLLEFINSHGFVMVIAHAEADYLAPLKVGDKLQVHLSIERIGNSSVSFFYEIYRGDELVGTAKTVHVALSTTTHKKMPVPVFVREKLLKYLSTKTSENPPPTDSEPLSI